MIDETSCVLFTLNGQRYAVQSAAVDRIVHLPELTSLPDAPGCLVGVFNLSGIMVPVLDLSIVLNVQPARYRLTDSVIVLHGAGRPFGIIANQVSDVCTVSVPEAERMIPVFGDKTGRSLIDRVATIENEIVLLLDTEKVLRYEDVLEGLLDRRAALPNDPPGHGGSFYRGVPPNEAAVFRERAFGLISEVGDEDQTGFLELVVFGLNGEHFGLPLECIREFCEIRNLTPVPCCPQHILGAMNLRGEILTVIDIRPILRMTVSKALQKVVVLFHAGLVVGVGIDDVYDLIHADPRHIARLPLAADPVAIQYFCGTVAYGNGALTILDVPKLLTSKELIVNEDAYGGLCREH